MKWKKKKKKKRGYNRGMSSLMEAILKNQFRQVSFPESGTWSDVNFSGNMTGLVAPGRRIVDLRRILSYTRYPVGVASRAQDTVSILVSKLTKAVKNVSDKNKFAGVELYDLCVYQQLGTLQKVQKMVVRIIKLHFFAAFLSDLNGNFESLNSLVIVPVVDEVLVHLVNLLEVLHLTQIEGFPHTPLLEVIQLLQTILHLVM